MWSNEWLHWGHYQQDSCKCWKTTTFHFDIPGTSVFYGIKHNKRPVPTKWETKISAERQKQIHDLQILSFKVIYNMPGLLPIWGPKPIIFISLRNSYVFYWILKCSMNHVSFSSLATCRSFCENRSHIMYYRSTRFCFDAFPTNRKIMYMQGSNSNHVFAAGEDTKCWKRKYNFQFCNWNINLFFFEWLVLGNWWHILYNALWYTTDNWLYKGESCTRVTCWRVKNLRGCGGSWGRGGQVLQSYSIHRLCVNPPKITLLHFNLSSLLFFFLCFLFPFMFLLFLGKCPLPPPWMQPLLTVDIKNTKGPEKKSLQYEMYC